MKYKILGEGGAQIAGGKVYACTSTRELFLNQRLFFFFSFNTGVVLRSSKPRHSEKYDQLIKYQKNTFFFLLPSWSGQELFST